MPRSLETFALRPLFRRRQRLTKRRVVAAAQLIDTILAADAGLRTQLTALKDARNEAAGKDSWKDPQLAHRGIELVRALFRAGRFSWAEYVFHASVWIEGVHEGRHMDGAYDTDIDPIARALDEIEAAEPFDETRYTRLNRNYESVLDAKFGQVCLELRANDIEKLWRTKPSEYAELRERGRRSLHHGQRLSIALRDLAEETYAAATAAAAGGGYRAAVTLLGASLEGLLLRRCLQSPARARRVAAGLPRKLRAREAADMTEWTFEMLIEICDRAGWLPAIKSGNTILSPLGLAHSIRTMRNWIHPGREARERPWKGVFGPDYELAHALYTLVATALRKPRTFRRRV